MGIISLTGEHERTEGLKSLKDYEREAERVLAPDVRNYIFNATETGETMARNISAFSKFVIRRRVLQGIVEVKTDVSYFDGAIKSELPFFPSSINTSPMYPKAILDILSLSKTFKVPIFVSGIAVNDPVDRSKLPKMVPATSPLVLQVYFKPDDYEQVMKQVRSAEDWGYKALAVTVDTERGVKLGHSISHFTHEFRSVSQPDIKKIRKTTRLPVIVKGVMTPWDAEVAIECGADGVGVSNHGGRTMDCGEAAIEVLPKIVAYLRKKKSTRRAEIFFDSGIRKGTDIMKALALGARGCLIGRPYFWALAVNKENGPANVTAILREELVRTAALCGVDDLSKVNPKTVSTA